MSALPVPEFSDTLEQGITVLMQQERVEIWSCAGWVHPVSASARAAGIAA